MIMHPSRFIGAAPARSEISVPAALLVLGVALSCSTACITSAVVQSVAGNHRQQTARNEAAEGLARNVSNRSGGRSEMSITREPLSIEQALRPALPLRKAFYEGLEADRVEVQLSRGPGGREVYTITACGDFIPAYAEAFVEYADHLRAQLNPRPVFSLEVWRTIRTQRWTVLRRRLE